MIMQEKNYQFSDMEQFSGDLSETLHDILATLRWQEQLVRYAIIKAEQQPSQTKQTKSSSKTGTNKKRKK